MPEGDTVHTIATYLRERLVGATIAGGDVARRPDIRLPGREVRAVRARGKHLWLDFADGTALRSHLGMWGSWHRYGRGEPWKKPTRRASIRLDVGDDVFVCFDAQEVELVRGGSVRDRHLSARLGPDLIADGVDPRELPARARELLDPEAIVADVLLDQRIAAGIGNVYKSEILFLHGVRPQRPLADVDDGTLAAVWVTASDLLRRNVRAGPRTTRFEGDGGLWVYGRRGRPCRRCGATIAFARLGRDHRDTYWCPRCQV